MGSQRICCCQLLALQTCPSCFEATYLPSRPAAHPGFGKWHRACCARWSCEGQWPECSLLQFQPKRRDIRDANTHRHTKKHDSGPCRLSSHIACSAVIGACAEEREGKVFILEGKLKSAAASDFGSPSLLALMYVELRPGGSVAMCPSSVENYGDFKGGRCRESLGMIPYDQQEFNSFSY